VRLLSCQCTSIAYFSQILSLEFVHQDLQKLQKGFVKPSVPKR
jgi:hypothetical protein